jgi:hypothetical protein
VPDRPAAELAWHKLQPFQEMLKQAEAVRPRGLECLAPAIKAVLVSVLTSYCDAWVWSVLLRPCVLLS